MRLPGDGRVLTVPVTRGAVVLAGEPVATIGGGGFFLRLAIPERHADASRRAPRSASPPTAPNPPGGSRKSTADRERPRDRRRLGREPRDRLRRRPALVEVPVGTRDALMVPRAAVETRSGIDFVTLREGEIDTARAVVLGEASADGATSSRC